MNRKLAHAAVAAFLLSGAVACSADDPTQPPAVEQVVDDEPDGMDCEADDKAKKEVPDCGFYAGPGKTGFVWWSWVTAGRTTPPAGWDPRTETKPYQRTGKTKPAATRNTKPKTSAKPTRSRRS